MANRYSFRSLFDDNFKILTWVLILFIAIAPNFLFMQSARAASIGGWNIGNPVAKGASTVYDATKNVLINGKDFVKNSWVKITPTATGVAKVLARGGAGYALSIAVQQLLGAVDWVLDPANNQIVYTPNADASQPNPNIPTHFTITDPFINPDRIGFSNRPAACSFLIGKQLWAGSYTVTSVVPEHNYCKAYTDGYHFGTINVAEVENPAYDPDKEEERKTLPLETVAQKVISNAAGGDAAAQQATTAAAADIVSEAETDNTKARPIISQAEANATTKPADAAEAENANEATGTSQPNTANPEATDIALEFPVFCNWAPTVCEAAQVVISFPQTLTNWWETGKSKAEQWATAISEAWASAKNWATENYTDSESTKVTVEDNSIIFDDSQRISFSNSCPTPQQFSVSFFGATQNLEFSYQPLCDFMSMIKPFVVAGSYLIGAYIVMGLSRGNGD